MRIALLSYRGNMYCGGQGVYLYHLSRALAARGHDVSILVGPPYPAEMPWAKVYRLHDENFINRAKNFLPEPDPLSMFQPLHFCEFALSRLGPNPEMLAFSLRAFRLLESINREKPFDIVHDNQGLGYGLCLIRAMGLVTVATIHHPLQIDRKQDLAQHSGSAGLAGFLAKAKRALYYPLFMQAWVARRLDRIITVSDFSRKLVAQTYHLDPSRISTVYNGVDHLTFRPLPQLKKKQGRILFVGSSEDRKKGILYLLRAMRLLNDPSLHLVIVDGRLYPGRVYARNLVRELGLSDQVSFREKVSQLDLISEYNQAEVAVLPSLFEGFGLPALEAMACGTPLIATTAGALPEVTGPDREAALVVPPGDERTLARALRTILKNSSLQQRLSQAARSRAERLFSWERAASSMEKIYKESCESFS
jgi:glycosyltransferase involved in cell wall biosynthesis